MEYQKIINLSDNTENEPYNFRARNLVKINDGSPGTYNKDNQIQFKTSKMRSNLCGFSDAYILATGTITVAGAGAEDNAKRLDERSEGVIFKNCAPFTNCISKININQIDNAKGIDVVMPMYNLIKNSDNYLKTSGSLWHYYRNDPNDNIANSESFKLKIRITGKNPAAGNVKHVSKF